MLSRRIIPCLDVNRGRVVKGINFEGLRDAGDPVELAARYYKEGADELTFLDISATKEGRGTIGELAAAVSDRVFVPFTVGGGIRSVEDARNILKNGADKVAVNSAAIANPSLITEIAEEFGSQSVVVAVDVKRRGENWTVYAKAGEKETALDALEWCEVAQSKGAGEILLTSIDRDGTKIGFDLELYTAVRRRLGIPIIASGGGGSVESFVELFENTDVDAALAASIFHFGRISIPQLKQQLRESGVEVRL